MIPNKINCFFRRLTRVSSSAPTNKGKNPTAVLESLERWTAAATFTILAGIAIDAWAVIHFRQPGETNFEILSKVTGDALIGGGLAVEFVCIIRAIVETRKEKRESDKKVSAANERASAADQRASDANKRAVEAQLSLARLRTPRRNVLVEHEASITEGLRPFLGTPFDVGLAEYSAEQHDFLRVLGPTLERAGWKWEDWPSAYPNHLMRLPGHPLCAKLAASNVEVHLRPEMFHALSPAATALASGLRDIGIAASVDPFPMYNDKHERIHIAIGER